MLIYSTSHSHSFHRNAPQAIKRHTLPSYFLKSPHHHHITTPNALNNTDANANATRTQSPVLSLRLSITPAALFHTLFENNCTLLIRFHDVVGHTDLTYNNPPLVFKYRFPVNIPFKGPTYATNTESFTIIQHPTTNAGDREFYVQSKSITKGIPGADAFEVILHWKAMLLSSSDTTDFTLTCSINLLAPLPKMVSSQLEKAAYQGIIDAYIPQFETLLLTTFQYNKGENMTIDKKEEDVNNKNKIANVEDRQQPTLRQLLKTISTTWPEWKNNRYWFLTPTGSPCHPVPSPLEAVNILEQLTPIWLKEKRWDKTWYRDPVFKGLVECLRLARPRRPSASIVKEAEEDEGEKEKSGTDGSTDSYYYTSPEEVVKLVHCLGLLCREDGMYTEEMVAATRLLERIHLVERKPIASVLYSLYTSRVWTPSLSRSRSLEKAAVNALNRDICAFIECSRNKNDNDNDGDDDNMLHSLPMMMFSLSELGRPCTELMHCLMRGLQAGMRVEARKIPQLVRAVAVAGGTCTDTCDDSMNADLVKMLLLNLIAENKETILRERRNNKRREIDMNQLMQFKAAVELECKDPVVTDILQNNVAVKEVFDTAASICQTAYYNKSNTKKKGGEAYTGSAVQAEVERCVGSLGLNYKTEQPLLNSCWVADIIAQVQSQDEGTGTGTHSWVVIEVDGPWHYTRNKYNCSEGSTDENEVAVAVPAASKGKTKMTKKKRQLLGKTAFKRRILERAGYGVVNVDVEEWMEIRGKRAQVEYLDCRIKQYMLKGQEGQI
jgi:hypothetical protein